MPEICHENGKERKSLFWHVHTWRQKPNVLVLWTGLLLHFSKTTSASAQEHRCLYVWLLLAEHLIYWQWRSIHLFAKYCATKAWAVWFKNKKTIVSVSGLYLCRNKFRHVQWRVWQGQGHNSEVTVWMYCYKGWYLSGMRYCIIS